MASKYLEEFLKELDISEYILNPDNKYIYGGNCLYCEVTGFEYEELENTNYYTSFIEFLKNVLYEIGNPDYIEFNVYEQVDNPVSHMKHVCEISLTKEEYLIILEESIPPKDPSLRPAILF